MGEGTASLKDIILADMKSAMRAKDKFKLTTIRLLLAAIKQIEIDEKTTLSDVGISTLVIKMIKQRQDAIAQFSDANRYDLADKENQEVGVLKAYVLDPLSTDEIDRIIDAVFAELTPVGLQDMGRIMSAVKPQVEGRADLGPISQQVKLRLQQG